MVETVTEKEEEKNEPNQAAAEPTPRDSATNVNGVNDQESDVPAIGC